MSEALAAVEQIERLEARVAVLEEALGIGLPAPPQLKMWRRCQDLLGLLLKRQFGPREALYAAIWNARPECEQPELKMVDIYIHRLRKQLRPHGITIETNKCFGYFMTGENKARTRALFERLWAEL